MSNIRNLSKVNRCIDFQGINFFTDIDLTCEVDGKLLFLGEAKERGQDLTDGQRFYLESLVKNWTFKWRMGYAFHLVHSPEFEDRIPFSELYIEKYYTKNNGWTPCNMKLYDFLEDICYCGIDNSHDPRDRRTFEKLLNNLNSIQI